MGMIARVRENFEDWPSAKIGPHENSRYTVVSCHNSLDVFLLVGLCDFNVPSIRLQVLFDHLIVM
jgi:hypothetical protein